MPDADTLATWAQLFGNAYAPTGNHLVNPQLIEYWNEAITLSALAADESSRTTRAREEMGWLLQTICDQPTDSHGTWAELVDNEVPLRLGQLCCQLLDTSWQHAAPLATHSYAVLLLGAIDAGVTCSSPRPAASFQPLSAFHPSCDPTVTARSLGQQLQQCCLLQRLPGLLTHTAETLQVLGAVHDPPAQHSTAQQASQEEEDPRPYQLAEGVVLYLQLLCSELPSFYSAAEYQSRIAPSLVQPQAHLAVAAIQWHRIAMDVIQARGSTPDSSRARLLKSAFQLADTSLSTIYSANEAQLAPMLHPHGTNHVLQCACMMATLPGLTHLVPSAAADSAGGNTNTAGATASPGSTNSFENSFEDELNESLHVSQLSELWKASCTAVSSIPAPFRGVLFELHIGELNALWAAAALPLFLPSGKVSAEQACAHKAMHVLQQYYGSQVPPDRQQQRPDSHTIAEDLPLHLHLPLAVLFWASQLPSSTPEEAVEFVFAASTATSLTTQAMHRSLWLQYYAQGPGVPFAPSSTNPLPPIRDSSGTLQSWAELPEDSTGLMLLLQSQLLRKLLALRRVVHAGDASAAAFIAASNAADASASFPRRTPGFLSGGFMGRLADAVCSSASGMDEAIRCTAQPGSAALRDTAGSLCEAYEDLLRQMTEAVTAGRMRSCDYYMVVVGCLALLTGGGGLPRDGLGCGPLVGPIAQPSSLYSQEAEQLLGLLWSTIKAARCCNAAGNKLADLADTFAGPTSTSVCQVVAGAQMQQTGSVTFTHSQPRALLPWLMLLGHCCLYWGEKLQALHAAEYPESAAGAGDRAGSSRISSSSIGAGQQSTACISLLVSSIRPVTELVVAQWVQHSSMPVAQHLSRAGYDINSVIQGLAGLRPLLTAVRYGSTTSALQQASARGELAKQLIITGNAFANPAACNNPSCCNVSGPSEAQLVQGSRCSSCKTARYCGQVCQKKHWKQHKPVCKALTAALAECFRC